MGHNAKAPWARIDSRPVRTRLDFDRRLNLEFHDRGLWRHNHGFKKFIAELTSVFGLRLGLLLLECRS